MIDVLRDYFHGDTLEATKDDAGVWVPVIRICDVFGLALKAQHRKLKGKSWAVMSFMDMTAADGKVYKMLCIHLDSLPMWFATIDTRRVKGELRSKLATYQKECARVVRDYFYGVNSTPATQNDKIVEAINNGMIIVPIPETRDSSQHRKLKGKSWATMVIMTMVAPDGKVRRMLCIHLDSLPMWFATIDTRRVKAELRSKLATYQKECARVVRDYFFGVKSTPPASADDGDPLDRRSSAVLARSRTAARPAGRCRRR